MLKKKLGQRGFTLIELLVVIAIIGILSSVVLVSLQSSRAKARDAKRIADIGAIQTALALYYDSHNQYPADLHGLVTDNLLPADPAGPNTGESYSYVVSSDSLAYHLGATLEQVGAGNGVLASDRNCHSGTSGVAGSAACTGFGAGVASGFEGFNQNGTPCQAGKGQATGSTVACYDLTP